MNADLNGLFLGGREQGKHDDHGQKRSYAQQLAIHKFPTLPKCSWRCRRRILCKSSLPKRVAKDFSQYEFYIDLSDKMW
jgi:hypothetical protein